MRPTVAFAALALSACVPGEPAGDAYGVYDVVGSLAKHECGQEAAPVSLPYARVFEVRRTETGVAYLYGSDGSILDGTMGHDGSFTFVDRVRVAVIEPEEVLGFPGCDLLMTTTMEGVAERVEDEETGEVGLEPLVGTLVTKIAPVTGSDCSELLASSASGGSFHALPCEIVFDLEGEPRPVEVESAPQ